MMSYRSSESKVVLLFSHLLLVASLYRVLMQENGDTATRLGLNFPNFQGIDVRREAQNVKQK